MTAHDVRGKRVLVYSLGMEGRDLAGWMLAQGAAVTVSDTRTDAQLVAAGATAPDGVERVVTGQPLLEPDGFDLVAVSQSVLRTNPAVLRAKELGIPVTSQMQLFLQLSEASAIGITGSSGKSTTTSLVAAMARAAGLHPVVGGNLGEALLARLDEISTETTLILEISHTQLQYTDQSPRIAALTNVTPNHLDQFTWDEYVALKRHLFAYQNGTDIAVLNADDPVSREQVRPDISARVVEASMRGPVAGDGAWLEGDRLMARHEGDQHALIRRDEIPLRGEHNVANVVMACAIAGAAGFPADAISEGVRTFEGVPHRLEIVGSANGVTWVNDSIATTPERAMAGLRAFEEPVVLLLGGREKNLPLAELRELVGARCRAVVCFGEAAELFATGLASAVATETVSTLDDAVARASGLAQPGDAVLLSPAGTSFDAYPSFEGRGEHFRRLVRALPGFTPKGGPS